MNQFRENTKFAAWELLSVFFTTKKNPSNVDRALVSWQADVVLLGYPLGIGMTASRRRNDLEYYGQRTDPDGPAMTWGMHAVGYMELGDYPRANELFNRSFTGHLSKVLP